MRRDVGLEFGEDECVNFLGCIVRNLVAESLVECEQVAAGTGLRESCGRQVGCGRGLRERRRHTGRFVRGRGWSGSRCDARTEAPRLRASRGTMTIRAHELHTPARAAEIWLEMQVMIHFDRAAVGQAGAEHGELRVIAVEAVNMREVMRGPVARFQICVALGATFFADFGQANRAAMIGVARGARRRERLRRVVDCAVVAGEAGGVAGLLGEKARARNVARAAFIREDRVREGQLARRIDARVIAHFVPAQPHDRRERSPERKPETPASRGTRFLKVIQIDSLCELLG